MAATTNIAHIPRFLLPQLTWTARATRSLGPLAIRTSTPRTIPTKNQPTSQLNRRSITTRNPARPSTILTTSKPVRPNPSHNHDLTLHLSPHRPFSTTASHPRDHHFDTLKFVQRLRDEGFSEPQAIATMKVLSDVIEESIQNLTRTMVLREDAAKATYTQKVDFAKLRSELLGADSSESSLTRASHERLTNELAKLNSRLRDEIARTQASVRLDLNLEKGRIREEANVQELKIKETETRIEQEVAGLRERVEGVKFSTLQWLM